MGSHIEINDTLKISKERGFPEKLTLEEHLKNDQSDYFVGKEFSFWNKDERLYHRPPCRVFLVEEIDGKWLHWGHALILEQNIAQDKTTGLYKITKLYDHVYQRLATINESPPGKSFYLPK